MSAIDKLNRSTKLLFRILSVLSNQWHPDAKLPELTRDDLDRSIQDADTAIQKLIDANDSAKEIAATKKSIVHQLGNGAKNVCAHIKPFLQTFLEVAVQGSAVQSSGNFHMCSLLDSRSQSFWVIGQWSLPPHCRNSLICRQQHDR